MSGWRAGSSSTSPPPRPTTSVVSCGPAPATASPSSNGRDGEWWARIEISIRVRCTVRVVERTRPQAAEPDLWLAFAPIKRAPVDFLARKVTELGVFRLWPVFTRHTAASRVNTDRLRANAVEAAEQCRRLTVPEVSEPVPLDRLIALWPHGRRLLVADETGGGRPIAEALGALGRDGPQAPSGLLVGPEGGFARSELDALHELAFPLALSCFLPMNVSSASTVLPLPPSAENRPSRMASRSR